MNLVKWITNTEIELDIGSPEVFRFFESESIKLYRNPVKGRRSSENSYYMRFDSEVVYSTGSYSFSENVPLENLCLLLNELGFIFWGTFKSEITPLDYMRNLQRRGILKSNFKALEAGEKTVKTLEYTNA